MENNAILSSKYPWITFRLDLTQLSYKAWMLLGECVSKCEHLRRVPLTPQVSERFHQIYLSKGVLATTAIEGNTLSEEEVHAILERNQRMPESKAYLEREVRNIAEACSDILQAILDEESTEITISMLCGFNRKILDGIPAEDHVVPGMIRDHSIVVGSVYKGPHASDLRALLNQYCDWMNSVEFETSELSSIATSILKAVIAHLYMAWIHPFGDGNGRTARLIEFAILLRAGIPSPAAHLLSNHYNLTRTEYYRQLDHASKSGGDICPFLAYALQGFRDGLVEQLEFIHNQNLDVYWRSYIYEYFGQMKRSDRLRRQRELALTVASHDEPLSKEQLILLTAKLYAGKKINTFSRDIDELIRMKLIKKVKDRYSTNKEYMLHYLPPTSEPKSTD